MYENIVTLTFVWLDPSACCITNSSAPFTLIDDSRNLAAPIGAVHFVFP